jgi:hypothetical protein
MLMGRADEAHAEYDHIQSIPITQSCDPIYLASAASWVAFNAFEEKQCKEGPFLLSSSMLFLPSSLSATPDGPRLTCIDPAGISTSHEIAQQLLFAIVHNEVTKMADKRKLKKQIRGEVEDIAGKIAAQFYRDFYIYRIARY